MVPDLAVDARLSNSKHRNCLCQKNDLLLLNIRSKSVFSRLQSAGMKQSMQRDTSGSRVSAACLLLFDGKCACG